MQILSLQNIFWFSRRGYIVKNPIEMFHKKFEWFNDHQNIDEPTKARCDVTTKPINSQINSLSLLLTCFNNWKLLKLHWVTFCILIQLFHYVITFNYKFLFFSSTLLWQRLFLLWMGITTSNFSYKKYFVCLLRWQRYRFLWLFYIENVTNNE